MNHNDLRENPKDGVLWDFNDFGRRTGYELDGPLIADVTNEKQRIVIANTKRFGLANWIALASEPHMLSQQYDVTTEHWFHQAEVHPAMLTHGRVRRVLGLGSGDFLTPWRVFQHEGVELYKMVDWDHDVSRLNLKHVPLIQNIRTRVNGVEFRIHQDPRLDWAKEIDVRQYLPAACRKGEKFDLIIGDLTVNSLEELLPEALGLIFRLLHQGGIYVYQAGPCSLASEDYEKLSADIDRMREVFGEKSITLSAYDIEPFAYRQAWIAGYKGKSGIQSWIPTAQEIRRIDRQGDRPFYSQKVHRKLFTLEPEFKKLLMG